MLEKQLSPGERYTSCRTNISKQARHRIGRKHDLWRFRVSGAGQPVDRQVLIAPVVHTVYGRIGRVGLTPQ